MSSTSSEMIVAQLLREMYPQNPDIVLGREARLICERLRAAGLLAEPEGKS